MTRYNAANNWDTTLSVALNSTGTTVSVADATGSPTLPFKVTIDNEIMNLTAAPTTATFTATRAAEGTVAAAHSTVAKVENRLTAEVQNDLWDAVEDCLTPVDLTGQATGDYIKNESGVWVPRTTAEVLQDVLCQDVWEFLKSIDFDRATISNSGATNLFGRQLSIVSGNTALSTAMRRMRGYPSFVSPGTDRRFMNWDRIVIFRASFWSAFATATGITWGYLGRASLDTFVDPITRGIGFRIENTAIHGITHDGTTLSSVNLSSTISNNLTELLIVSDSGNVEWFVNGVSRGTSAGGPAGNSGDGEAELQYYLTNGADAAHHQINISNTLVYVEA